MGANEAEIGGEVRLCRLELDNQDSHDDDTHTGFGAEWYFGIRVDWRSWRIYLRLAVVVAVGRRSFFFVAVDCKLSLWACRAAFSALCFIGPPLRSSLCPIAGGNLARVLCVLTGARRFCADWDRALSR